MSKRLFNKWVETEPEIHKIHHELGEPGYRGKFSINAHLFTSKTASNNILGGRRAIRGGDITHAPRGIAFEEPARESGYSSLTISDCRFKVDKEPQLLSIALPRIITWAFNGFPVDVYGYFYTVPDSGTVISYEYFPTAPYRIRNLGDQIKLGRE